MIFEDLFQVLGASKHKVYVNDPTNPRLDSAAASKRQEFLTTKFKRRCVFEGFRALNGFGPKY
jgi:hypothetical protein